MSAPIFEQARKFARELRKRQTHAEKILWENLRSRKFLGKKFLRQHPIFFEYTGEEGFFIADFYCHEHRLVLEIDGKIHEYQKEYDRHRTEIINDLEINVLRFKNDEIEKDLKNVLEQLKIILTQPLGLGDE